MNRLLIKDHEYFETKFPEAARFLDAGHNRYEAFSLYMTRDHLTEWQKERLYEMLQVPSCREPWFLKMLGITDLEEIENV